MTRKVLTLSTPEERQPAPKIELTLWIKHGGGELN